MHEVYFDYIKAEQIKLLEKLKINSDETEVQIYIEQAKLIQLVLQMFKKTSEVLESLPEEKFETMYGSTEKEIDLQRLYLKQDWSIKNYEENRGDDLAEEISAVYKFSRLLVGGELSGIKAYLPEEVVRKNDIEHGDMVRVYPIGVLPNGDTKYAYALEEKMGEEAPKNRKQHNYCLVEESSSNLICKSNKDGIFREDDIFPVFHISDKDAFKHELAPGDIVDIAIENNDWQKGKVIWKHEIKSKQIQKKLTVKSDKKTKVKSSNQNEEIKRSLKGKTVLIVSNKHDQSSYESPIAKRGGKLLMADRDYSVDILNSLVAKSDAVILITSACSHRAMWTVKDKAKELGIPFIPSRHKGTTHNVNLAEQIFMKEEILFK
ncbi:DUF2325 domain-containing protein [Planomicrobium chinense]|uniref:DUF2325 domain-containing protein n=1 Tax=Planococcus chinensis TaxID=272917 RepID=UPI001CC36D0F|nr:DUF2325 domain-containing protein [Planococcus chinensis]MBZ5201574.1 DUF2325 domain-containing protein [Planococcus chinensis]